MRSMTKSPVLLAHEALRMAEAALPQYSSVFSRKDYTQHQLFALLVLRQFFKTDYRGIIQLVQEFAEVRRVLKLDSVPHYSTLCYAHQRLLKKGLLTPCLPQSSSVLAV